AGQTFCGEVSMNYQAFTKETLVLMHQGARGALAVDDQLAALGQVLRFKGRDTLNWTLHVAELEAEMARRGMIFEAMDCAPPVAERMQPHETRQEMNALDR